MHRPPTTSQSRKAARLPEQPHAIWTRVVVTSILPGGQESLRGSKAAGMAPDEDAVIE